MITALIVAVSLGLAGAFTLAWLVRPDLRQWVESPKHGFHERARRYDRASRASPPGPSGPA